MATPIDMLLAEIVKEKLEKVNTQLKWMLALLVGILVRLGFDVAGVMGGVP